ncbi:YcdB/YcdC domain-containing protein [Clostridium sp. Cult3]|uniref:YcdB/YcdC domain-containing protein n=1 Tax=Clostridium sp. Cult3 TaxID=2079004 RepID=UPI001F2163FC|nr:YcdB/YcdC domain-containing protein [Clostridium sp. Cult3]MCF6461731.1 S-layer protein [Clostridium sp. Cult3]
MKNVKIKSLLFMMVLTLLVTCIPSNGFAEDGLDKRIEEVKALFEIGDDYERFDKYQYDIYDGRKITNLSWKFDGKNIGVGIDEEGNVTGYWKNIYDTGKTPRIDKFPKITREQGEKIAKNFIKKVYPDILDKIQARDETDLYGVYIGDGLAEYRYNFVRVENDVEFNENNLFISVDTQTGEVVQFNISWEEGLEFPDTEGIISKEEAKKIYNANIDLELLYKVKETDKDMKSYLGYNIIDTDKTVDAKTGDILNTSYKLTYSVYGSAPYQDVKNIPFEEENELIKSKKIISRKEAAKKILDTFKLGENYEVEGHRLKGNKEKDIYVWEVMVTKHVENHGTGTSSRINAKTGEIIDFSDPGSWVDNSEESKHSKEDLLKKAKKIIQKNSPEKYKEVEYIENENENLIHGKDNVYSFLFLRKANGLRVENNGFMVTLSGVTGDVLTYNYNWSDLEFESPKNIIGKDKAKETLLKNKELELEYQMEIEEKEKKNVKLVYDFRDKYLAVDAKEAEVVDNRKKPIEKAMKEYKDIENSFAKDQIEKLQESIFLFAGEEFKPKQEITQKEFFRLLGQTKGMLLYEDQAYLYERFVNEGIVKKEEENMDGKVTREEAIKYIVRAFGQEPLENMGDIYKIEYNDEAEISPNLKGHIAIARGLGIISKEGNLRPKDNLTREEAAVLIYNILNRD